MLLLLDAENIERFLDSMADLDAPPIAIPPFAADHLERGHVVHFRCRHEDAAGLRIDVMAHLRGVDPFDQVWNRRTTIETVEVSVDLLSLPDLVAAKKTQRDKDWPMIRRLVERSYFDHVGDPDEQQIHFWFQELRTPELLVSLAESHQKAAVRVASQRPALQAALRGDALDVERELSVEQAEERRKDCIYWDPLKAELERFRRAKRRL